MLEYQNITIHRKKRKIVENISLSLEDGVIFGFLGSDREAGSTILQASVGRVKPSFGEIILDGEPVTSPGSVYLKTGYMSKNYGFYEQLTVEEYYEVFLALYKVNGRYRGRRVDEVLNFLEMEEYRNSFIGDVPKELRPFLCLGKTILHDPSWLFFDEPFANMAPADRKRMLDYLWMLWEQGKSLVISSQIYPELPSFLSDMAVMEGGRIVTSGTVDSCYEKALKESPIRMCVLEGMDEAVRILRENDLVERVTVNGEDVILLFSGGEKEEAQLLSRLVDAGVSVCRYVRDPIDLDQLMWR